MTSINDRKQSISWISKMFRTRRSTKKQTSKNQKQKNKSEVLGGVYHDERDNTITIGGLASIIEQKYESSRSLSTADSTSHDDEDDSENLEDSWSSSDSPSHHQGTPLLVRSAVSQRHLGDGKLYLSDEEVLGRIMVQARKLPKNTTGYFVSNHVMINNERTKRTRVPLKRNPSLDELAREHANKMATQLNLMHPNAQDLKEQLVSPDINKKLGGETYRLGVNVGRGSSVCEIHKSMMSSESDKNNMIDRRFVSMGVGTAKGADGAVYLCQIFSAGK